MKIVYKIINSLLTLAIVPVLMFLSMFRFIAEIGTSSTNALGQLAGLFTSALGDGSVNSIIANLTGIDIENMPEFYTLKEAYDLFFGESASDIFSQFDASILPEELVKGLSAAGILLIAALVCAVIVLILGLFTKKRLFTASFAGMGIICTVAANYAFNTVSQQLCSGKISIIDILSQMEAFEKYSTYINMLNVDIKILELSSAYTMLILIFSALIILNVGFKLADSAGITK